MAVVALGDPIGLEDVFGIAASWSVCAEPKVTQCKDQVCTSMNISSMSYICHYNTPPRKTGVDSG